MKKILLFLIASSLFFGVKAQLAFSDSIQLSLLTCDMGADSYERFGHTGVRVNDLKTGQDIVFHWGVYNFNEPHFVLKFIKGITDYQIGALYTEDFVDSYRRRGLGMTEQKLDLSCIQAVNALDAILTNYRPENRKYRYNFFFDNCATRPFDIINEATGYAIAYDTTWVEQKTLREILQEKTFLNNWLDFGISLAVAQRSDKISTFKEQMFLPEYLKKAYDNACIDGHKLVDGESVRLLETTPGIKAKIDNQSLILSPNVIFYTLLIIVLLVGIGINSGKKSAKKISKILASFMLFGTGVAGIIIWFLNFFSLHPAVDHNVNCLWLLPTNIIFAALLWTKSAKKVCRIYFFIIFAAVIAYVIINIGFVHQYFDPAFLPLILSLSIIVLQQIRQK